MRDRVLDSAVTPAFPRRYLTASYRLVSFRLFGSPDTMKINSFVSGILSSGRMVQVGVPSSARCRLDALGANPNRGW